MNCTSKLDAANQSLSSIANLLLFRFLEITPSCPEGLTFNWNALKGTSSYVVQLTNLKEVIWRDTVTCTDTSRVVYTNKTPVPEGTGYLFTVEVGDYSLENYEINNDEEVAKDIRTGIEKINQAELPSEFRATVGDRFQELLSCRNEAIDITRSLIAQDDGAEILRFALYNLERGGAIKSLAEANACQEVLDSVLELANIIAAANIILGRYFSIAKKAESLSEERFSKALPLALFPQSLQQVIASYPPYCPAWYNYSPAQCCSSVECRNYPPCLNT
jgi:hypothetical protein